MTSPSPVSGWEAEHERLRNALQALDHAAKSATRENDQPNRVIFRDGFTIEGRAADEWHKFMRLITSVTSAALSESEEQTTADGWIEWKGGECPVPVNTAGTVKLRDGTVYERKDITDFNWGKADWCLKAHREIIAYRLTVSP